ncbi:MAG: lytic transglycosylase domain-containing protein [bacterium]
MIDRTNQRNVDGLAVRNGLTASNGLTAQVPSTSLRAGMKFDFNGILQDSLSKKDNQSGEKPLEQVTIELLYRAVEAILSKQRTEESCLPSLSFPASFPAFSSSFPMFSSSNWPNHLPLHSRPWDSRVVQDGNSQAEVAGSPRKEGAPQTTVKAEMPRPPAGDGLHGEQQMRGAGHIAQGSHVQDSHVQGSQDFEGIIGESARKYNLDPALIKAVIAVESGGDPKAVSPAGAQGLMQLMPGTAAELGVNDPFDPAQNIMGGTRYLRQLLDRYGGKLRLALAAYNWGMGNLENRPNALPKETQNYILRIEKQYRA